MGRGVRALVAGVRSAGLLTVWAPASLPMRALNSVVTVDTTGSVGRFKALGLDAAGNAVVGNRAGTNGGLKVVHAKGSFNR
jgi:hypothetical protein